MPPLILTVAFLALFGIITTSEVRKYVDKRAGSILVDNHLEKMKEIAIEIERAKLEKIEEGKTDIEERGRRDTRKKRPKVEPSSKGWRSLNFSEERPPNNSRLNFYTLLVDGQSQDFLSSYQIAARLIRTLYSNEPFYHQGIEFKILDELIEKREKATGFFFPDELAAVPFEDKKLQECFLKMLKGEECLSLLYFITFDSVKDKINFIFASEELLSVLFDSPSLSQEVLDLQANLYNIIIDQEENRIGGDDFMSRSKIKKDLKNELQALLRSYGKDEETYLALFDLSLGKRGNIIFSEDKKTGLTTREKIRFKRL